MWKQIPNTDFYFASDDGQVKSVDHFREAPLFGRVNGCVRKGKILKQTINSHGYPCVAITFKGEKKQKVKAVHKLIAMTFLPKPNEDQTQINHKDGNKLNNHIDNLEWCTAKENIEHSYRVLHRPCSKPWLDKKGKLHPNSVPVLMCDLNDNPIKEFESMSMASEEMNISVSHICACVNNRRKSCGGYHWKRKTTSF